MRLSKLHASSSDSGDLRYETESNHSGASFKGFISNSSTYNMGLGKSGTVTPDMESLVDDTDLPYYNQLHAQQIQKHMGKLVQSQKKTHEPQSTVVPPKQSYSSAKQTNAFGALSQNVHTSQLNSHPVNTHVYSGSQYASSAQLYHRNTSHSGETLHSHATLDNGKPRVSTNDPQAYVQQLASKISSHLMQQQQQQQQQKLQPPLQPASTSAHQSHYTSNHGIAGGFDLLTGQSLSRSMSQPGSNSSSYYGGFKTDGSMHATDGNSLNTQKFASSNFSDRISKTTSEDSYYSNPSSSHVAFGSNSLQPHHPFGVTQSFSASSFEEKSSYLNDYFDTSRSTGSDDFNFGAGAIREIMEGIGNASVEQADTSLFVNSTDRYQGATLIEEQLKRTRQHTDDQLSKAQDPLFQQDNFGELATGKTPFGGLRKKVRSFFY